MAIHYHTGRQHGLQRACLIDIQYLGSATRNRMPCKTEEEGHGRRSTTTDLHRLHPVTCRSHYRHPMSTTSVTVFRPPAVHSALRTVPLLSVIRGHASHCFTSQQQSHGPSFLDIPFGLPPPALSPYHPIQVPAAIRSFVPFVYRSPSVGPPIAHRPVDADTQQQPRHGVWSRLAARFFFRSLLASAPPPFFLAHFWNIRSRAAAFVLSSGTSF
jgi:hypothetical protein